jgi:hypothetical protein
MVKILCQADKAPVWPRLPRSTGSAKRRFTPAQAIRLRLLELENGGLNELVAERDLDIEILKDVAAKESWRAGSSQQVACVCQRGGSVRRACALLSVSRSTLSDER